MSEERLYTEAEVAHLQQSEAQIILKGLLRNLTEVRAQRGVPRAGATKVELERQRGEINGLNIAIAAVRRRLR